MHIEKVVVGSTNRVKTEAVEELFKEWDVTIIQLIGLSTNSGVRDQPLSLEETLQGAKNRAEIAYQSLQDENGLGVGIESGLMPAPGSSTGYLEATVCCFYDGKQLATGLSCGFEVPAHVLKLVLDEGMDLGQACYAREIGGEAGLGSREGLVGLVTNGRIPRKAYTKQAVAMALGQWLHPEWYRKDVESV